MTTRVVSSRPQIVKSTDWAGRLAPPVPGPQAQAVESGADVLVIDGERISEGFWAVAMGEYL